VGGQFCRRPMRAAFKRRCQGGVLWDCFFLVMDDQKKIAQRPAGQPRKQQPDADLDAGAYNLTSRRRQSPPRREPRQRIRLAHHVPFFLHLRFVADASTLDVQERLRIATAAQQSLLSCSRDSRRGRNASTAQTGQRDPCEKNFPESALTQLTVKVICRISHKEGADASLIVTEATSV